MGAVWWTCPNCGEEIGASWNVETDDEDSVEPFGLTLKRASHMKECEGSFKSGAAVAFGLMAWAEAIREWERGRKRREEDAAYERAMAKLWGTTK